MRSSKAAKNLSSFLHSSVKKTPSSKNSTNLQTLEINSTNTSKHNKSHDSVLQEFQKHVESEKELFKSLTTILGGSLPSSNIPSDEESQGTNLKIPWFPNTANGSLSHGQKVLNASISERTKVKSRERKEKSVFRSSQTNRFSQLVGKCDEKLGTDRTLAVFDKLRRECGPTEHKVFIQLCVDKARTSLDEEESVDHIYKAYGLLKEMREQGFLLDDETFASSLLYLIDMGMVEEFEYFTKVIKDGNSAMLPRLGYYEMLLWIRVEDEDKVQELCDSIVLDTDGDVFHLAENYLLALCKTDRKKEILQLLEVLDIRKLSSIDYVSSVFESMGRLSQEELAEKFILTFKTSEVEEESVSCFICTYVINLPNLAVEDVISKLENLHKKLDVRPSSLSYEKLVIFCCGLLKVHAALAIIDHMCQLDLALSVEIFYPVIHAVEESCELDLVHPIYSVIRRHNLKPKSKAMESLINLSVKMKDFEGAYNILSDIKEMGIKPTSSMYNAVLAGYCREKKFYSGEMVLNQMKHADVKPDSRTFSFLIANSECEKDIIKYFEEMQSANVEATKYIYMALINAYANCGKFEKAKQVVLDQGIPAKSLNEIKSVLVSALASRGKTLDALKLYDEIKESGFHLEPKAIISLIEHPQPEGELNRMLQFLEELKDPDFWFAGCERVVIFCIRHKHLSSAINLLKQLKEQDKMSTYAVLDQVFCQIFEINPIDLQIGLDLLLAVKEELKLSPSRTSLDFLLSACVSGKDPLSAKLIWKEYQKAGLSYNVLTYMRMYQLHLACGEHKAAMKVLKNIPQDDPHVRTIIKASKSAYSDSKSTKGKRK